MYLPKHFAEDRADVVVDMLRRSGFGHLVCAIDGELISTPIPFVVDDDISSVRAHVARANKFWSRLPCTALLIVPVTDAYVSPSWYPSKADHGKVVPTWNYEVVHLHGRLVAHDDPTWIRRQVDDLTRQNEANMPQPWSIADAPSAFLAVQTRVIVGVELCVERMEAKRKLSQNRSPADIAGVIAGIGTGGRRSESVAEVMRRSAL